MHKNGCRSENWVRGQTNYEELRKWIVDYSYFVVMGIILAASKITLLAFGDHTKGFLAIKFTDEQEPRCD